jgi:hypothetical protein
MAEIVAFAPGGYRFIKGILPFSYGVAADAGFEIERVRFRKPVPLEESFRAIEAYLESLDRPLAAFCACELRSPGQFTEAGFAEFNQRYIGTLDRWGLYRDGVNPVARSNVCPEIDAPTAPSFHAFAYTVPVRAGAAPSFVLAGAAEAREGPGSYPERIVRMGDTSPDGLREKARFVLAALERRMQALNFGWADVTATQLYTVFDAHPLLADEFIRRGAAPGGVTWHYARPPVQGLDFEIDVRGVAREIVV